MSSGCRKVFGSVVLAGAMAWCAPALCATPAGGPLGGAEHFEIPLVALAPTVTGKEQADDDDVIFAQPLRPEAAVRTTADFPVHLEKTFRGALDLTVPAGTVFVKAMMDGHEYYCATRVAQPQGFGRGLDVGLCLFDGNGDGAFDAVLPGSQFVHRIRSPFEMIRGSSPPATMAVSVPTETLAPERIPPVLLRARFYNDGAGLNHMLFGQIETLRLEVCWPPDITLAEPDPVYSSTCAATDWTSNRLPRDNRDVIEARYAISPKTGETDTTTWGPVAIAITGLDKKKIAAHVTAALPPGPLTSWVANVMILGDIRSEIYILHLQTTAGMPAAAPPVTPSEQP